MSRVILRKLNIIIFRAPWTKSIRLSVRFRRRRLVNTDGECGKKRINDSPFESLTWTFPGKLLWSLRIYNIHTCLLQSFGWRLGDCIDITVMLNYIIDERICGEFCVLYYSVTKKLNQNTNIANGEGEGLRPRKNHRPLDTKESDFLPYLVIIFIILALPYYMYSSLYII